MQLSRCANALTKGHLEGFLEPSKLNTMRKETKG